MGAGSRVGAGFLAGRHVTGEGRSGEGWGW